MGVSIEIWRARVGAFHPVMLSLTRERKVRKKQRLFRTYKRPPDDAKTHHVSLHILICLLSLLVACFSSRSDPLGNVRRLGPDILVMNATVMYLGVSHGEAGTWRERLTLGLRMAFFVMLLMCGDVESNPGPKDSKTKKTLQIRRLDTEDKYVLTTSSLESSWKDLHNRWKDVTMDGWTLMEEDGTEICDDDYFKELADNATLYIAIKDTQRRIQRLDKNASFSTSATSLEKLWREITGTWKEVTKANWQLMEEDGTEVLDEDYFSSLSDIHPLYIALTSSECMPAFPGQGRVGDALQDDLEQDLRDHYATHMRYLRQKPWEKDSEMSIDEAFKDIALYVCKKSSKRPFQYRNRSSTFWKLPDSDKYKSVFEETYSCSGGDVSNMDTDIYERIFHGDVFKIEQNNARAKRVVITGNPGVGKTTLLRKMAFDWARGLIFKNIKVLVHLSLGGISRKTNLGEEILRQLLPKRNCITGSDIENVMRQHANSILLLLDGFDESDLSSLSADSSDGKTGSLLGALEYTKFRGIHLLVTNRLSKRCQFQGDMFNPYAQVILVGFARSSINAVIEEVCVDENKQMVKDTIINDLSPMRPLLRIPLFLVMICDMVSHKISLGPPFTLTNLITNLCSFMFMSFRNKCKLSKVPVDITATDEEELLHALGKLSITKYHISIGNDTQPHIRKQIELGLKTGFLWTNDDINVQGSHDPCQVYFFHNLIRLYCIAKCKQPGHSYTFDLHDQLNDNSSLHYERIFQSGLYPGLVKTLPQRMVDFEERDLEKIIQQLLELSPDMTKKQAMHLYSPPRNLFLLQCFFEAQLTEGLPNQDYLTSCRSINIDLNLVNSLPSIQHFLKNTRSEILFEQIYLRGEMDVVDTEPGNDPDTSFISVSEIVNLGFLIDLISHFNKLGSLNIYNCHMSTHCETEMYERSSFNILKTIDMRNCRSSKLTRRLLNMVSSKCPGLKHIRLENVNEIGNARLSNENMNLAEVLQLFLAAAPHCDFMRLADVKVQFPEINAPGKFRFPCQTILPCNNIDCLILAMCGEIDMSELLGFLSHNCPNLHGLNLRECVLVFLSDDQKSRKPYPHVVSDNIFILNIENCEGKGGSVAGLDIGSLFYTVSSHYPNAWHVVIKASPLALQETEHTHVKLSKISGISLEEIPHNVDLNMLVKTISARVNTKESCALLLHACVISFCDSKIAGRLKSLSIFLDNCTFSERCATWPIDICNILHLMIPNYSNGEFIGMYINEESDTVLGIFTSLNEIDPSRFPILKKHWPRLERLLFCNYIDIPLRGNCDGCFHDNVRIVFFNKDVDAHLCLERKMLHLKSIRTSFYGKWPMTEKDCQPYKTPVKTFSPVFDVDVSNHLWIMCKCFPNLNFLSLGDVKHFSFSSQLPTLRSLTMFFIDFSVISRFSMLFRIIISCCPDIQYVKFTRCQIDFDLKGEAVCPPTSITTLENVSFTSIENEHLDLTSVLRTFHQSTTYTKILRFENVKLSVTETDDDEIIVADGIVMINCCKPQPDILQCLMRHCKQVFILVSMEVFLAMSSKGEQSTVCLYAKERDAVTTVRHLQYAQMYCPDVRICVFMLSSFDLPPRIVVNMRFPLVWKTQFLSKEVFFENRHISYLISTCFPNLQAISITEDTEPGLEIAVTYALENTLGIHIDNPMVRVSCDTINVHSLLMFLSSCFSTVMQIDIDHCKLSFDHMGDLEIAENLTSLQKINIINLPCPINVTRFIAYLDRLQLKISEIEIMDTESTFSSGIDTSHFQVLKKIVFHECSLTTGMISHVLTFCHKVEVVMSENLKFNITKIVYPDSDEEKITVCVISEEPIQFDVILDIMNWCPEVGAILFYGNLEFIQPSTILYPNDFCFSNLQYITLTDSSSFQQTPRESDLYHDLDDLDPHQFSRLLDELSGEEVGPSHVASAGYGDVNILGLLAFITSCCPQVTFVTLANCLVSFDFTTQMTSDLSKRESFLVHFNHCVLPSNYEQLFRVCYPWATLTSMPSSFGDVSPMLSENDGHFTGFLVNNRSPTTQHGQRPPCMEVI